MSSSSLISGLIGTAAGMGGVAVRVAGGGRVPGGARGRFWRCTSGLSLTGRRRATRRGAGEPLGAGVGAGEAMVGVGGCWRYGQLVDS